MSPRFSRSLLEKSTRKVSTLKSFLKLCLDLVKDENELKWFYSILEEPEKDPRQEKFVDHIHRRRNIRRELCMKDQIGDYDMDLIILDSVLYFNILTKKTWKSMGKTKLVWSLLHLWLENQLKVSLVGRLPRFHIEVEGI